MAQRSDQRTRTADETVATRSERDRSLGARASSVFSPKFFLLASVLFGVALVAGNALFLFVPLVGGLIALALVAFGLGLVTSSRRYFEVATAGALSSAAATLLGNLFLSIVGNVGVPMAAAGAVGGLVAAVVGYYFGRDLRNGLTKEI